MVGGMLHVHGIMDVILPPKGEPNGFEKEIAETLIGIISKEIVNTKKMRLIHLLYFG